MTMKTNVPYSSNGNIILLHLGKTIQFTAPLREHPFGLVCLGSFLFCSAMFLPFNFISVQAEIFGISAADASYLVVVLNSTRNVY
jgi:hypothetical protein